MQRLRPPSLQALVLTPVGSASLHQIHFSTTMRERTVKAPPSPNCSPHPHSAEEQTKAPLRAGGQSHTALVPEICMRTGLFQSPGHTLWPGPHQPELSETHSEAHS